ncbi:MAG: hypothetical protein K2R98_24445 [Gemmataceae bacterium]|nr:hypothetical protein [Gemmataceae bacterium]
MRGILETAREWKTDGPRCIPSQCRRLLILAGAFLLLGVYPSAQAHAGVEFGYAWSYPAATALVSDNSNYALVLSDLGLVPQPGQPNLTGSADTLAARLSLHTTDLQTSSTDTFGSIAKPQSFLLNLVLTDVSQPTAQDNSLSPFAFKVDFSMDITNGTPSLTSFAITPLSDSVTLNGNTYTVSAQGEWFKAPTAADGIADGSVVLHIGVGQPVPTPPGGGVHESPEPSSLMLAMLGMASSGAFGIRRWLRRRHA